MDNLPRSRMKAKRPRRNGGLPPGFSDDEALFRVLIDALALCPDCHGTALGYVETGALSNLEIEEFVPGPCLACRATGFVCDRAEVEDLVLAVHLFDHLAVCGCLRLGKTKQSRRGRRCRNCRYRSRGLRWVEDGLGWLDNRLGTVMSRAAARAFGYAIDRA